MQNMEPFPGHRHESWDLVNTIMQAWPIWIGAGKRGLNFLPFWKLMKMTWANRKRETWLLWLDSTLCPIRDQMRMMQLLKMIPRRLIWRKDTLDRWTKLLDPTWPPWWGMEAWEVARNLANNRAYHIKKRIENQDLIARSIRIQKLQLTNHLEKLD